MEKPPMPDPAGFPLSMTETILGIGATLFGSLAALLHRGQNDKIKSVEDAQRDLWKANSERTAAHDNLLERVHQNELGTRDLIAQRFDRWEEKTAVWREKNDRDMADIKAALHGRRGGLAD